MITTSSLLCDHYWKFNLTITRTRQAQGYPLKCQVDTFTCLSTFNKHSIAALWHIAHVLLIVLSRVAPRPVLGSSRVPAEVVVSCTVCPGLASIPVLVSVHASHIVHTLIGRVVTRGGASQQVRSDF